MSDMKTNAGSALLGMALHQVRPITGPRDAAKAALTTVGARPGVAGRPESDRENETTSGNEGETTRPTRSYSTTLQNRLREAEAAIPTAETIGPEEELAARRKADLIRAEMALFERGVREGEARARSR